MTPKGHFEINWPLGFVCLCLPKKYSWLRPWHLHCCCPMSAHVYMHIYFYLCESTKRPFFQKKWIIISHCTFDLSRPSLYVLKGQKNAKLSNPHIFQKVTKNIFCWKKLAFLLSSSLRINYIDQKALQNLTIFVCISIRSSTIIYQTELEPCKVLLSTFNIYQ